MFRKFKITTFAAFTLLSLKLSAQESLECSEVRLDLAPESMAKIPVYSQENHDICYAVLAAEMTDAYRISHGRNPQHLTSVFATAAFYSGKYRETLNENRRDIANDEISMGSFTDAVSVLREKGSCNANILYNGQYESFDKKLRTLRSLRSEYKKANQPLTEVATTKFSKKLQEIAGSQSMIFTQEWLSESLSNQAFYKVIDKVITKSCEPISESLADLPPLVGFSGMKAKAKAQRQIDFYAQLKFAFERQRPQPIAINFCREALFTYSQALGSRSACSPHSALIVGRRKVGSSCQVLIRESEGPICNPNALWPCELLPQKGQYWVPVDKMAPHTSDLMSF